MTIPRNLFASYYPTEMKDMLDENMQDSNVFITENGDITTE